MPGWPGSNPIANHYIGFVKFVDPAHFPQRRRLRREGLGDRHGRRERCCRTSTSGQVLDPSTAQFFTRDGDVNQEDITNGAVRRVAGDGLLPLQPHRQPRRRPLLAADRSGRARPAGRRPWRAALALLAATAIERTGSELADKDRPKSKGNLSWRLGLVTNHAVMWWPLAWPSRGGCVRRGRGSSGREPTRRDRPGGRQRCGWCAFRSRVAPLRIRDRRWAARLPGVAHTTEPLPCTTVLGIRAGVERERRFAGRRPGLRRCRE